MRAAHTIIIATLIASLAGCATKVEAFCAVPRTLYGTGSDGLPSWCGAGRDCPRGSTCIVPPEGTAFGRCVRDCTTAEFRAACVAPDRCATPTSYCTRACRGDDECIDGYRCNRRSECEPIACRD